MGVMECHGMSWRAMARLVVLCAILLFGSIGMRRVVVEGFGAGCSAKG